jgi:hypothetical protein
VRTLFSFIRVALEKRQRTYYLYYNRGYHKRQVSQVSHPHLDIRQRVKKIDLDIVGFVLAGLFIERGLDTGQDWSYIWVTLWSIFRKRPSSENSEWKYFRHSLARRCFSSHTRCFFKKWTNVGTVWRCKCRFEMMPIWHCMTILHYLLCTRKRLNQKGGESWYTCKMGFEWPALRYLSEIEIRRSLRTWSTDSGERSYERHK